MALETSLFLTEGWVILETQNDGSGSAAVEGGAEEPEFQRSMLWLAPPLVGRGGVGTSTVHDLAMARDADGSGRGQGRLLHLRRCVGAQHPSDRAPSALGLDVSVTALHIK